MILDEGFWKKIWKEQKIPRDGKIATQKALSVIFLIYHNARGNVFNINLRNKWYSFFLLWACFFFFFYQGISPAFDFSTSKGFSNSGALKDFRNFFMETLGYVFESSFVKLKKNRYFRPPRVGSSLNNYSPEAKWILLNKNSFVRVKNGPG